MRHIETTSRIRICDPNISTVQGLAQYIPRGYRYRQLYLWGIKLNKNLTTRDLKFRVSAARHSQ